MRENSVHKIGSVSGDRSPRHFPWTVTREAEMRQMCSASTSFFVASAVQTLSISLIDVATSETILQRRPY